MLVGRLRSAVADDDIGIGSVADRCLFSVVKQKSHFKGVRTTIEFLNFGKVQSECPNCVAMPIHTRQPMLPERMRAKIFSRASPKVGFAL